jgi:hypothetical protein
MSTFAIIFRVPDPARKAQVIQRIKSYGPWMSYFDGVWLIEGQYDVATLQEDLNGHIRTTDSLLILEVKPHAAGGWLPPRAWEWLEKRT